MSTSANLRIEAYKKADAALLPPNPHAAVVAEMLGAMIRAVDGEVQVEHIGSTAVPGCSGKGVVDLAVLYPPSGLEAARDALDALGFQRQDGPEPWPESRPMRVASAVDDMGAHRVHAHVIQWGSPEHAALLRFRDLLRADETLRLAYEKEKAGILEAGVRDSLEYSKRKGAFIGGVLNVPIQRADEPA